MGLDQPPSTDVSFSSTSELPVDRICEEGSFERGSSRVSFDLPPEQIVHCSKEGFRRQTSDPRPSNPQQIYPVSQLQNDNGIPSSKFTSKQGMGLLSGSKRRILARARSTFISAFSGILHGQESLQIQSNALRTQCSPQSLHQTWEYSDSTSETKTNQCHSLSGRLAHMGPLIQSLSSKHPPDLPGTSKEGLHNQSGEIQINTSPEIFLAWNAVESGSGTTFPSSYTQENDPQLGPPPSQTIAPHQEGTGKNCGLSPVLLNSRPLAQGGFEGSEQVPTTSGKQETQRSTYTVPQTVKESPSTMVQEDVSSQICTSSSESDLYDNSLGRLQMGMGGSLELQGHLGSMVPRVTEVSHQLPRVDSSFSMPSENEAKKGLPCAIDSGQQHGSLVHQQGGVTISNLECGGQASILPSRKNELDYHSQTPPRSPQCSSRHTLEEGSSTYRVVPGSDLLFGNHEVESSPRSRSLCNFTEPSSPNLRLPSRRPSGDSNQCLPSGVERLESPVPLSTNLPDFEGFTPNDGIQRNSLLGRTRMASKPLVSEFSPNESQVLSSQITNSVPENQGECGLRFILSKPEPSRVDFLAEFYSKKYTPPVVDLLLKKLRKSSNRQYQSVWKLFTSYVRTKNPPCINESFILDFLTHQFSSKDRKPSTIKTYKSTLRDPLKLVFDIDVNASAFHDLSRAMDLSRPAERNRPLSWSLNKVLDLLSSEAYTNLEISEEKLLAKTAFLIMFASGGRISEITSLRRGDRFIINDRSGDFALYPSRSFMAKNENPQNRRPPIKLRLLGESNPLCPATTLQRYLSFTSAYKYGSLFLDPSSHKNLSIRALSKVVLNMVRTGDPSSFPRTHDIRKYASSVAFLSDYTIEEIASSTGWKSHRVFLNHYLRDVDLPSHTVQSAGIIVSPTDA